MRRPDKRILIPVVLAMYAFAAVQWYRSRPRVITVCVLTDIAFRERSDWAAVVVSRLREVTRIYERRAGIRWKIVGTLADITGLESGIDTRRAMLAHETFGQADLVLAFTGRREGTRTGSVVAFSHAAVVVDFSQESESRNVLFLAYELTHLFGVPHDAEWPESLAKATSEKPGFGPRTQKLIRQLRKYDFAAGSDGLDGAWDQRATNALAEAFTGVFPNPEAHAHQLIAMALERDQRNAAAIPHLRQVVQADPKNPGAHHDLGAALSQNSQNDEAISELREALRLDPHSSQVHGSLGAVLGLRGYYEEADDQLTEAIRLDPNNAGWYDTLGSVRLKQVGRIDEGVAALRTALGIDPTLTSTQRRLERALGLKAQAQAEVDFQRERVQETPRNPDANYSLGLAEANAGDLQSAAREYTKALELNPKHGQAHIGLATLHFLRKDYAEAWQEVKKARALGAEPGTDFIDALKRRRPE